MSPEDLKTRELEEMESAMRNENVEEKDEAAGRAVSRPRLERRFTRTGVDPLDEVKYDKRKTVIVSPEGGVVFQMDNVEAPHSWSQLATDILVSKYFRKAGVPGEGHETSVRQVVRRVARTIRNGGEEIGGYFDSTEEADVFEAELTHLLVNQKAAFNSPVWFNCGLYHEYEIQGSGGNWYWGSKSGVIEETPDSYSHPQCSACFIQKVEDDLMSLFDLMKNEARLFKYGSGTGTNFSKIRGHQEKLSGGGTSSGLMSFLEVLDRGAGATKSGGTTRRAAKMVCLDMDHPEIVDFINWKVREERKVQALIQAGFDSDFNGEAYRTVSGQNSNNSVRITDAFMQAVLEDGTWETRFRTMDKVCGVHNARDLFEQICAAAWSCADPGVQFDTTINRWHTCKVTDRINASNPCSEFMFLDDTACNLSSVNLMKFMGENDAVDVEGLRHAVRVMIVAQEILVDFSSYPTKNIAKNSHDFRPLGLGYANLGAMLMAMGIPYDSKKARSIAAALTAILCGHAYRVSAELAARKGPFQGFAVNRECMLEVIDMHRREALAIDPETCPERLSRAAREDWEDAYRLGKEWGFRNSQVTVLAPTGTIGLLMDCDTTGIEPDFALVKFKKLAGGGYFKIVNQSLPRALKRLGYTERQIQDIIAYACGSLKLIGAPHVNPEALAEKGFTTEDLRKIEARLEGVFDLKQAFAVESLGEETLSYLGFKPENYRGPDFDLLSALGFTRAQIEEANRVVCGVMTVEGAPHLKAEHLAIFDCANKCGAGERFIAPMAHLEMMAAAQKFISGAISKTVNLPEETTVKEIEEIYKKSWSLGLKAVALYRDNCKMSQPLISAGAKKKAAPVEEKERNAEASAFELELQEAYKRPKRKRLPKKRRGVTHEAKIAGHKVYLRTGEYDDGSLGEIFIDMHKEGAAYRSILNCFAIAVSLGLQYGVPLEEFVNVFTFTRFEPQGPVDHPNIKMATSVIDYIFRLLAMDYMGRVDFVHVKPMDNETGEGQGGKNDGAPGQNGRPAQSAGAPKTARAHNAAAGGNGRAHLDAMSQHYGAMMGDAPFCDQCGHVTVRNGSCYKCMNCGNSVGCS